MSSALLRLREQAKRRVDSITSSSTPVSLPDPLDIDIQLEADILSNLPDRTSQQPHQQSTKDFRLILEDFLVLQYYLARQLAGRNRKAIDHGASSRILAFISHRILPGNQFAGNSPFESDERPALTKEDLRLFQTSALLGIELLSRFEALASPLPEEALRHLLICYLSFCDPADRWSNDKISHVALDAKNELLERYEPPSMSCALSRILREVIKPAFQKSRNPAITKQGRRAIDPIPQNLMGQYDAVETDNPWKFGEPYIPTLLQSITGYLNKLEAPFIENNWPLLTPPILAMIDDSTVSIKAKGCKSLDVLLQNVPSQLLDRTGLREVFENALMPCLMYLPSLTEEKESLLLLEAAYPTIIRLANSYSPRDYPTRSDRTRALDRIMREGLLAGYSHAAENVRIAEFLCQQMEKMIREMRVEVVRHMKHLVPIISANLTAHMATAYPPLLKTTLQNLQTLILYAWPRLDFYSGEILKGLAVSWCEVQSVDVLDEDLKDAQESVKRTTHLLLSSLHHKLEKNKLERLVESEPKLQGLLSIA